MGGSAKFRVTNNGIFRITHEAEEEEDYFGTDRSGADSLAAVEFQATLDAYASEAKEQSMSCM